LKIAVNTRLLLKNRMEGIGWFTFETLKRITKDHPEHQFYFIFDRPFDPQFIFSENIIPVVVGPQSRHPLLWYIWFNWSLAGVLKRIKPDLFLSPEGYICLNTNVKSVNVMHDIAYEHYPETVPALVKIYYRYFFPRFARKACRIATVSAYSKQDIVEHYGVSPHKMDVVYNGCNEVYHPLEERQKEEARKKWADGKPYFVYVGGINPRKNIKNLLLAFDRFKNEIPSETRLLLVGKKGYGSAELEETLSTLKSKTEIHFLGRVEDVTDVNAIISGAVAMTYISVFEGFGIPCLEAMRCGTAVITSNTSSLPEVCGAAALYVDPLSVDSISAALKTIDNNGALRQELIEKGYLQAQQFSWQKTADLLWGTIEKAIKE
jgi:glycosyltransferase involved in cell wall biosynthesis